MDTAQVSAGDGQVPRQGGAAGEDDRVEAGPESVDGVLLADLDSCPEDGALVAHLNESSVQPPLLQLEFRDTVTEQAADPVGSFEHDHLMAHPGELLGRSQPGRS